MANAEECPSSLIHGEARLWTAMAVIPVKILSKSSNQTVITYAFLDNGCVFYSNKIFTCCFRGGPHLPENVDILAIVFKIKLLNCHSSDP